MKFQYKIELNQVSSYWRYVLDPFLLLNSLSSFELRTCVSANSVFHIA